MQSINKPEQLNQDYITNLLQESFWKAPDGVYVTFKGTFLQFIYQVLSPLLKKWC